MFGLNLLEMTNEEIDDMCDVIKYLGRPSHWKILRALLDNLVDANATSRFLRRKDLLNVTGLTNVTKDMKFLIENDLVIVEGTFFKSYRLKSPETFDKMIQNAKDLVFEYKNQRDYRC